MLSGLRVIEIEALGPAPFAGMTLADLGADVIVVHRKTAETAPGVPEQCLLDRGKRSIALDLKDPADVATLLDLVATADALIEGFRPGVMDRLGLGPEACHAVNPRLVYGRMTGWGQTGPLAPTAGHDMNYIGVSGALWYASAPGQPPMAPPTLVGDIGGGALYLVIGVLAGVMKARVSGKGTVVDAAIVDGSAHMMNLLLMLGQSGALSEQRGQSLLDGPHWCRTYRTADGGCMSVQCLEPRFYSQFLERMGLSDDPAFARQFDRTLWPDLTDRLAALFATRPRAEWEALFEGSDACVAPVLSPQDAARHPHLQARGTWQERNGVFQAAAAPRFDGAPARPAPAVPQRGAHGEDILAEIREAKLRQTQSV